MRESEANRIRYARATYGSLAYDLNRALRPEIEIPEEPAAKPERESKRKVRIDERKNTKNAAKAKTRAKGKAAVAPFGVLGFAAAAVMLVMVLMGYVQLTKISAEASSLQKKITDLKNTEARLKIKYESTFDLSKVEEYATGRLGMVPVTNSQIYYVKSAAPDKAEIISDSRQAGIVKNVTAFLSRVVEYFK